MPQKLAHILKGDRYSIPPQQTERLQAILNEYPVRFQIDGKQYLAKSKDVAEVFAESQQTTLILNTTDFTDYIMASVQRPVSISEVRLIRISNDIIMRPTLHTGRIRQTWHGSNLYFDYGTMPYTAHRKNDPNPTVQTQKEYGSFRDVILYFMEHSGTAVLHDLDTLIRKISVKTNEFWYPQEELTTHEDTNVLFSELHVIKFSLRSG